jgi:hypothetical protein
MLGVAYGDFIYGLSYWYAGKDLDFDKWGPNHYNELKSWQILKHHPLFDSLTN